MLFADELVEVQEFRILPIIPEESIENTSNEQSKTGR